jgi:RimJ/RimL family protein N-acetyltransferase
MSTTSDAKRTYPWQTTLNGKAFTLRLLERKDRETALKFAREVPKEDLLFLTLDITNAEEFDQFLRSIEENKAIAVLIEADGRFVGYGSLSYNQLQWTRHLGEIRLLVDPQYRRFGLGKLLVNEVFLLAQELQLQKLVARMAAEQKGAIQVFERLGFKAEALLADHVIDRDGQTHDLIMMTYDIKGFNE